MRADRLIGVVLLVFIWALAGCAGVTGAPTSRAVEADVPLRAKTVWNGDYLQDIQPIFDEYCIQCHGPNKAENGLRLDSYQGVMKGTQYGPVVVPGFPGASTLVSVIQGTAAPEITMPHKDRRLSPNRIHNVVLWIEDGARNQ